MPFLELIDDRKRAKSFVIKSRVYTLFSFKNSGKSLELVICLHEGLVSLQVLSLVTQFHAYSVVRYQ
jgi:hypothetical protein